MTLPYRYGWLFGTLNSNLSPMERYRAWVMGVDHRTRWCDIASGGISANSHLLRGLSIENRSAVMIQQTGRLFL